MRHARQAHLPALKSFLAWTAIVVAILLAIAAVAVLRPPAAVLESAPATGPASVAAVPQPGSLLHDVLAAHGGMERWSDIDQLRVKLCFGGFAFKARFIEPEPTARWITIELREPRVVFHDYPETDQRGVFTPGRVWIESAAGAVIRSLDRPRHVLMNSRRRQIWWNDLDLLYFAGYASWNYLQGPFLFLHDGVEAREIEPWHEAGETWRRLSVHFHESIPTHNREQIFYFDRQFRLRHHDYRPDVYAYWARAAHYASDYRQFDGIWFPTSRRAYPRGQGDRVAAKPLLVWINVDEIEAVPEERKATR